MKSIGLLKPWLTPFKCGMKGLKSLKKDIQDIRNSMDNLYQNKILDGDKAPDTVRPEPKCKVCED